MREPLHYRDDFLEEAIPQGCGQRCPIALASESASDMNSDDVVLSVRGVSKKFCRSLKRSMLYGVQDIGSELLGLRQEANSLRKGEFWALDRVNFKLRRGEAIGLIGANGSGKTTLLRIISGLIKPDRGMVRVRGRVAPLIALGAGFSPVLTGRENIYANLSILGLSKAEIDRRFDEVVEFAEIGEAIEAPVHSYSSGMAARLGFSCAVHTDPDILLIDEVLAVGDIKFIAKCHRRLHQLRQKGTAFVLVAHNPQAILSMCPEAVYLQKGRVMATGDAETVMAKYEADLFLGNGSRSIGILQQPPKSAEETTGLDITGLWFRSPDGKPLEALTTGDSVRLCIQFLARQTFDRVNLRISIMELGRDGMPDLYLGGSNDKEEFHVTPGTHELQIEMPYLGLSPGHYMMRVDVRNDALFILDIADGFRFTVQNNGRMSKSAFYQPRRWKLLSRSTPVPITQFAPLPPTPLPTSERHGHDVSV
ncbi:ABC transporter ATP-binding protein [Leptolyngbya ohadii]|uniref:ABC transporter ATP-binding protein n=1 Tax=Leptolyngbya ohadii TaxID=1962290 RepID=UPI0021F0E116|nr:ABC transporter ATP-binding protein [Leptolyngbya ohadii]